MRLTISASASGSRPISTGFCVRSRFQVAVSISDSVAPAGLG